MISQKNLSFECMFYAYFLFTVQISEKSDNNIIMS